MSRVRQKLTKRIADAAQATADRYTVWDAQMPGFGLRITAAGTKTFVLRYRAKGRRARKQYITLGRFGVLTVDQARDRARKVLGQVADGLDPIRHVDSPRPTNFLADVADSYLSGTVVTLPVLTIVARSRRGLYR